MKKHIAVLLGLLILASVVCGCGQKEIADGIYTVDAVLSGGSGRASVESPVKVVVADGKMTATVVWSSPFYEYMLIGETRYDPIQKEGNATFEIPIVLDEDMSVSALTVAMSEPHLVEYTLRFDSKSLKGE